MIGVIISITVPFVCGTVIGSMYEKWKRKPMHFDFPAAPNLRL